MSLEWSQLRYHAQQSQLWRSKARFKVVCAGRGSGKTELARRFVVRQLPIVKPWVDPIYFYALPTRDQAKRIAWGAIKNLIPRNWIDTISESELTVTTRFGSKLYLLGMDKPARAEGVQWDFGVIDECSDQKPGVFDLTFRPALVHRQGGCWRIGVPKRAGAGAANFKEAFDRGIAGLDSELESYSWPSSDIMSPSEIAMAKSQMDIRDFREQFEASWETVGGLIHYAFSDIFNIDPGLVYNPDLPLLIGSDFNVDPMAWVIGQYDGKRLGIFDEFFIHNANTQLTLLRLKAQYGDHKAGFKFYGDASGRARKTSASETDYVQIKNFPLENSSIYYPLANPAIHDRFAAVNAMCCNAAEVRRLAIHPRCKYLKHDLMHRSYKEGSNEPDDSDKMIGHISDAMGYLIHYLFPLRVESYSAMPVMNF